MQIVIQLDKPQLAHLTNQQMGAFVAHCYTLNHLAWVKVYKDISKVEISFELPNVAQLVDSEKLEDQMAAAVSLFGSMEPYACNCGCGAFISVTPCFRQSGDLVEKVVLNAQEMEMVRRGDRIGAIKTLRERANANVPRNSQGFYDPDSGAMGLKEAKDMIDAYWESIPREEQAELIRARTTHGYAHYANRTPQNNSTP